MNHSRMTGISFGLTSGAITTVGMMVGLQATTNSVLAVLGGILAIAIADAFSDAMGIHISEESSGDHRNEEIWESTIATFVTKFLVTLSFAVPVLLLPLGYAIVAAIIWGAAIVATLSFYVAKRENTPPERVVTEHLVIMFIVVVITRFVGDYLARVFI